MNPAISNNGRRTLWVAFWFLVLFLYAPIVVLIIFSFNDSEIVSFPWVRSRFPPRSRWCGVDSSAKGSCPG